jgi:hypothetical protein
MRNTVLAMLALILAACGTKPNPAVCCISQADCDSVGIREPIRNCQDELVCVDNACVAPECEVDQDCTGDKPFCSDRACVGCRDDGDCASDTPVCDEAAHACRACVADADCASQACDFETGACMDASSVLYASPSGSDQAECSQQQPCSLSRAILATNSARFTVKLLAGVYTTKIVTSGRLDVHGDGATVAPVETNGPVLHALNGAKARIYGLALVNAVAGTQAYGFLCDSSDGINTPELQLDRVAVDTQKSPGFLVGCELSVSRSTLKTPRSEDSGLFTFIAAPGNATFDRTHFVGGSGIFGVGGGNIGITNSVLEDLLGSPVDGALYANGGSISISFSTIFNVRMPCGSPDIPACASTARVGICIDNSIISNPSSLADSVTGPNCRVSNSIVSPQQGPVTGDNNMIGVTPSFKDPANKDFHLNADSPAINAANPAAVATPDYDGVMRPQGGRSDIGAFEFKE